MPKTALAYGSRVRDRLDSENIINFKFKTTTSQILLKGLDFPAPT